MEIEGAGNGEDGAGPQWAIHLETGEKSNGEAGIRTRDTGLTPYNGLANRRLQPLGHLSKTRAISQRLISA
jgi:hypothetical protein